MRRIIFVTFLSVAFALEDIALALANIPEDGRLEFCELAQKYGHKCVRYNVTTEDGYILGVYNIPGNRSKPVYCQHGIFDSSDTFAIRGNDSWIAFLAQHDYDIWLGNTRGNMHSRSHVTLDPDKDLKFWDFSFHELGIYDVASTIDHILEITGQKQLQALAHSQGTTTFFILGSMRKEYNHKVKTLICLAPVAYVHHAFAPLRPVLSLLGNTLLGVSALSVLLGAAQGEVLRNSSVFSSLIKTLCTQPLIGYPLCNDAISVLLGPDPEQIEDGFLQAALGHYPAGTSFKNPEHILQTFISRKFAAFDYGLLNLQKYNSFNPPEYNLRNVVMKTVLIVGLNDRLSTVKDVNILRNQIKNLVEYYELPYEKWNHVDFVWGKYLPIYLYDYVLEKLKKYS